MAAAKSCNAHAGFTGNIRDFPPALLSPSGLGVLTPDECIADMIDLDQTASLLAPYLNQL